MLETLHVNVILTKNQERWIRDKVRAGEFDSGSEVIREALRVYETLENNRDALEELILEGEQSGPAERITGARWKRFRAQCRKARRAG